jgi:UDP-galactopyranose mutase
VRLLTVIEIGVVGAGAGGCAIARRLAEAGCRVELYEARAEVGGNCQDAYDEHGVLVHCFGPHYFRADDDDLIQWLSHFTQWVPGRYCVRARVGNTLIPLPISLATMTALKGQAFSPGRLEEYLAHHREEIAQPCNAEEQCLATVGRELYELLFAGYTEKQWGTSARDLDPSVTARLPLRFDWDERYVNETYQIMPKDGYTAMFRSMIDHPLIALHVQSAVDAQAVLDLRKWHDAVVFTGPIDALFDHRYGQLGYRSLRFEWQHYPDNFFQPCVQINYPDSATDYTRTVEAKHVTQQVVDGTTVCYEYPSQHGPPFYPILNEENLRLYDRYRQLAAAESRSEHPLLLLGRLAEFRYYNMDQVLLRATALSGQLLNELQ